MAIEVSTLAIEVTSKGIATATDGLKALALAADAVEGKVTKTKTSTDGLAASETKAAAATSNYADKMVIRAAVVGKNMEFTTQYMASVKKLSEEDTKRAVEAGRQLDNWKNLAIAQTEAIRINKELDKAVKDNIETEAQQTTRLKAVAQAALDNALAVEKENAAYRESNALKMKNREASASRMVVTKPIPDQLTPVASKALSVEQLALNKEIERSYTRVVGQMDAYEAKLFKVDAAIATINAHSKLHPDSVQTNAGMIQSLNKEKDILIAAQLKESEKSATGFAAALGQLSFSAAGARNEIIVLGREMTSGNWSRVPGSLSLLIQRTGAMNLAMMALTSPITAVAIGLGAIGVAAYEGSLEINNFNKAMVMTGNYAGLTSGQFTAMSKSLAIVAGVTAHDAANGLSEVAASGSFASTQIELVTKTALQLEKSTGQAVGETIKTFQELGKDPVAAVLKLQESYKFLTVGVYDNIKSLVEQGDTQGAVTAAVNAYADVVNQRTPKILEQAGSVERAWRAVRKEVAGLVDSFLNLGRPMDAAMEAAKLLEKQASIKNAAKGDWFGGSNADLSKEDAARLAFLQKQVVLDEQKARSDAAETKRNSDAVLFAEKENNLLERGNKALRERNEIAAIKKGYDLYTEADLKRREVTKSFDAKGNANYSGGKYDEDIAAIKYANRIAKPKSNENDISQALAEQKGYMDEEKRLMTLELAANKNAYDVGSLNLKEYLDNARDLQLKHLSNEVLIAEKELEIAGGKKNKTAMQNYANSIKAIRDQMVADNRAHDSAMAKAANDNLVKTTAYNDKLVLSVKTRQDAINDALYGADLGAKAKAQNKVLLAIQKDFETQMDDLQHRKDKHPDAENYALEEQTLKETLAAKIAQEKKYNADSDLLQADWLNGAKAAYADYSDSVANVASQSKAAFTNAFTGMTDALVTFATTGKLNFKNLAISVLADIARMQIAAQSSKLLGILGTAAQAYFGGSSSGSTYSAGSSATDTVGTNYSGSQMAANGAVFNNGQSTSFFANGGAFANGIVHSPTNFNIGTMGEAGPEAIVPLTKTADGSLGVKQTGGSNSNGPVNVNQTFNITSSGTSDKTDASAANDAQKQFMARMAEVAKAEIARQQQSGGLLWNQKNGRP